MHTTWRNSMPSQADLDSQIPKGEQERRPFASFVFVPGTMSMWSAIKSDLLDFVSTIQSDTTTTLSKVLGDDEDDEVSAVRSTSSAAYSLTACHHQCSKPKRHCKISSWQMCAGPTKPMARRALIPHRCVRLQCGLISVVFAQPLRENKLKEFERFKKKFALSSYAQEIAQVLDIEPEVSRFYAELVPLEIPPEEFWARLFFRLHLLTRNGTANFEDEMDEEEELVWEDEAEPAQQQPAESLSRDPSTADLQASARIRQLEAENARLQGQVAFLLTRVTELEMAWQDRQSAPLPPSAPASISAPTAAAAAASPVPHHIPTQISIVTVPVTSPAATHVPPAPLPTSSSGASAADSSSQSSSSNSSSSGSAVMVSREALDDSIHQTASKALLSPPVSPSAASGSMLSEKTSKYLAALDDEEGEEEDGWN